MCQQIITERAVELTARFETPPTGRPAATDETLPDWAMCRVTA
jgi:hypothetical protein